MTINPTEIRKLTAFEIKQKDFLLQEYPMLDETIIETLLRIGDEGRDKIVEKLKSGELKLEETKDAEEYIKQSVNVL